MVDYAIIHFCQENWLPLLGGVDVDVMLLDLREASRQVGLSHWTLRLYIRQGKLQAVRLGRRVMIEPDELRRFVRENRADRLAAPETGRR